MANQKKITLTEAEIPEKWYNIVADMPNLKRFCSTSAASVTST